MPYKDAREQRISEAVGKRVGAHRANCFRATPLAAGTHFAHADFVKIIFSHRLNHWRAKRHSPTVRALLSILRQNPTVAARAAYRRARRRRAARQQDIHHPNIIGSVARRGAIPANAIQECQCSVHWKNLLVTTGGSTAHPELRATK
ncbi:MAG: hypothetical protein ACYDAH_01585 [Steroidobacteraceae bacterium]